jgi:hypothetical protein
VGEDRSLSGAAALAGEVGSRGLMLAGGSQSPTSSADEFTNQVQRIHVDGGVAAAFVLPLLVQLRLRVIHICICSREVAVTSSPRGEVP